MSEILIVKPSSFGDIVHGLQVAETLRRRVPHARISWVAATAFVPIVRACDTVEAVYPFERAGGLAGFFRLVRALRSRRFDYILDMQGLARSALITRLARGTHKIGRADAREGARLLVPSVVTLPSGGRHAHAIEVLARFLVPFGCGPSIEGRVSFNRAPPNDVHARLPKGKGPLVIMFPGSRQARKDWPGFGALTQRLFATHPEVRIAWSDRDQRQIPAGFPEDRFADLCGSSPLNTLPALLAAADCVVANDSGPMHLAAAMGRRVVAVFGPTDPKRFAPWPPENPRHLVVCAPGGDLQRLEAAEVAERIADAGFLCPEPAGAQ